MLGRIVIMIGLLLATTILMGMMLATIAAVSYHDMCWVLILNLLC